MSLNYLREFGSETGNARERLIALMEPGRVYQQVDGDYEPLASQEPGRRARPEEESWVAKEE